MSPRYNMGVPAQPPFERTTMLRRLATEEFDVVVVGGGITGTGVALDAVTRGLRTALVERDDFASGTSSKSSKLVHGGLRYLQQGEVRLVYEALRERQRLKRNAPHLVRLLPFMIPILVKDGLISKKIARALGSALWMYDLTGGARIGRVHRRLRRASALAHMPTMDAERLSGAYLYYDTAADDARLCLTVARTAAAHGAAVANGARVTGIGHDASGKVSTVQVDAGASTLTIRTRVVVNATGVWADEVRALDEGSDPARLRPAKGVHVTVPWEKVRNTIAVIIPVPKDKRSLFLVPWGQRADGTFQHTYVGTTDTDYDGPLDDPQCTKEDLDYVLAALGASVTTGITADDVTGTWAGLRPLVDAAPTDRTADLSRRHSVQVSASGVVTVTGGKLTTYREMAEDAIDAVALLLGSDGRCRTKRLRLLGGDRRKRAGAPPGSLEDHLDGRHGSLAAALTHLVDADPSLGAPLVEGLPYLRAEAVYAARHEMARSVDDVLSRRTRARLLDRRASVEAAPEVARLLAAEHGWDEAETSRQADEYRELCAREAQAGLGFEPNRPDGSPLPTTPLAGPR